MKWFLNTHDGGIGMRAFIVSDNESITAKVRRTLLREGHSCSVEHELSLDMALATSLGGASPEVLVVVLSPDPERVLACLGALRSLTQARLLVVRSGEEQGPPDRRHAGFEGHVLGQWSERLELIDNARKLGPG